MTMSATHRFRDYGDSVLKTECSWHYNTLIFKERRLASSPLPSANYFKEQIL